MKKLSIISCLLITFLAQAKLTEEQINKLLDFESACIQRMLDPFVKDEEQKTTFKRDLEKQAQLLKKDNIEDAYNTPGDKKDFRLLTYLATKLKSIALAYWTIKSQIMLYEDKLHDSSLSDGERKKFEKEIIELQKDIAPLDRDTINRASLLALFFEGKIQAVILETNREALEEEDSTFKTKSISEQNTSIKILMKEGAQKQEEGTPSPTDKKPMVASLTK